MLTNDVHSVFSKEQWIMVTPEKACFLFLPPWLAAESLLLEAEMVTLRKRKVEDLGSQPVTRRIHARSRDPW